MANPFGPSVGPKVFQDLSGRTFAHWSVLGRAANKSGRTAWRCLCVCGAERDVSSVHLTRGKTKSCGCIRPRGEDNHKFRHGESGSPLYVVWLGMIQRCENINHKDYENYGGRGIRVCERWRSDFTAFRNDIGERPDGRYSLDRFPNAGGNYEPGNVRWASATEQVRNRRVTRRFTIGEHTKSLAEWCEIRGRNYGTVKWRLRQGQSIEEALR